MPFKVAYPMIPPKGMRTHTDNVYLPSAVHTVTTIDRLVPVSPATRVLDVGCAAGRMAMPLLGFLDPEQGGSYDGFDVKADRIAWATEHITSAFPNFRFRWLDVHSMALNPAGMLDGAALRFPYASQSFDLIAYSSVFTHLLRPEALRYLQESVRCLAPEGRIYSTWYLWDEGTAHSVAANDVLWAFPFARDGHRIVAAEAPERAVAYDYDRLVDDLGSAGLAIDSEHRGNWRSAKSNGQDILILRRA
jgi:SAM-dependent methyltransferase